MILTKFHGLLFHKDKTGIRPINLLSIIEVLYNVKCGEDYHVHQNQDVHQEWIEVVIDRKLLMWLMLSIDGLKQFVKLESKSERQLETYGVRDFIKIYNDRVSFDLRCEAVIGELKYDEKVDDGDNDRTSFFNHSMVGALLPRWHLDFNNSHIKTST